MLSLCYPCSGKAAYGMMKDMEENPKNWEGRKVLFLHTGRLLGGRPDVFIGGKFNCIVGVFKITD